MRTRDEIAALATGLIEGHFARFRRKPRVAISNDVTLAELGADSLDTIEIVMAFEDLLNIEISDAEAEDLKTFGQMVDFLTRRLGMAVLA